MAIDGFYTVKEASRIIGRSESIVCRYIRMGMLPAVAAGKTWLIRERHVHEFTPPPMGNPNLIKRKS